MRRNKEKNEFRRVPTFFNPRLAGENLKEVDVEFIETESNKVMSRWFHGVEDADLFVWTDQKNNIIKHQVTFCGQVVEWNILDGLRTGVMVEQDLPGPRSPSSEAVHFDSSPVDSAVRTAWEILRHVRPLDEEVRRELMGKLLRPESVTTMDAGEFVCRYGARAEGEKSLWLKFKKLFARRKSRS